MDSTVLFEPDFQALSATQQAIAEVLNQWEEQWELQIAQGGRLPALTVKQILEQADPQHWSRPSRRKQFEHAMIELVRMGLVRLLLPYMQWGRSDVSESTAKADGIFLDEIHNLNALAPYMGCLVWPVS